jgi:hypothetical protein
LRTASHASLGFAFQLRSDALMAIFSCHFGFLIVACIVGFLEYGIWIGGFFEAQA